MKKKFVFLVLLAFVALFVGVAFDKGFLPTLVTFGASLALATIITVVCYLISR